MDQARSPDIASLLGEALQHHRAGNLEDAERIFHRILAVDPRNADSLHLLGMIDYQRGLRQDAAEKIRRAIAIDGNYPAYHSNLGTVLQALGELDEAAACYERALAFKPDWADLHSNLGNIQLAQGKPELAAASQDRALALNPDLAEAHSNLGNVLQSQGRLDEAVARYERALLLKPDYATAHNNLGNALAALGRIDDAADHYQRALALRPDYADACNNLGNIRKAQGKFEEATALFEQAIRIRPAYARAHFNRAEIKTFHSGDPDLAMLQDLAARNDLSADDAMHIHFGLAKALADSGDHLRSFEYLRSGNALKRSRIHYDEKAVEEYFARIASIFTVELFDRLAGQGHPSPAPVFVLGMPRSGSTLIEQILASHPQVHGAGELTILEKLEASDPLTPYPDSVPRLTGEALHRLGESYVASLPHVTPHKLRIVDKLPGNFLRAGLIRLILTNARIIHTVRDPIDTCVSCYSKLFEAGLFYTYDLGELGRFYARYHSLMRHWRHVLPPASMLDVRYEDVVDDLEGQARRLIAFCGLPWDDRCLGFHQNNLPVKTASAVQVRQPLFRSSLQRWRKYEAELGPLLAELKPIGFGNA